MQFALILNNDPIFHLPCLRHLLRTAHKRIDCVLIVPPFQSLKIKRKFQTIAWQNYGLGYWLQYALRFLREPYWSFDQLCRAHHIQLKYLQNVNQKEFYQFLNSRGLTAGLSVTSQIYSQQTLHSLHIKLYNLHAGLLPENKGLFPIVSAFKNQQAQGITVHEITPEIDNGPILYQERIAESGQKSLRELTDLLFQNSPAYLEQAIRILTRSRD